jgi:CxxC-x17-CxxC domain-containing protein
MYKAICSNCGKECEVPFRPTSGKPVYCSDCFEKMGGRRQDSPRPERSDFRSPGAGQNNNQFDSLNAKLDRIIKLLEPEKKFLEPKAPAPTPAITTHVVLTPPVEKVIDEVAAPKTEKIKTEPVKVSTGKKAAKKKTPAKKK